jgi:phage head maturation protease
MNTKTIETVIERAVPATGTITFCASQEVTDSYGDVVLVDGIDLTRFKRNPVLLADHDKTFVIGAVARLWLEDRPAGRALMAEATLLPAGISARIDEARATILAGARRGVSIGFKPLEWEPRRNDDGQNGYTFRTSELIEISSVALPACPTCLIESKSHGGCGCRSQAAPEHVIVLDDEPITRDDDEITMGPREAAQVVGRIVAEQFAAVREELRYASGRLDHDEPLVTLDDDEIDVEPREVAALVAKVMATEARNIRQAVLDATGRLD